MLRLSSVALFLAAAVGCDLFKDDEEGDNTAPGSPSLYIIPASPTSADDLYLSVTPGYDNEGDVITHQIVWSVGGQPVSGGNNQLVVPAAATIEGQTWTATVTPNDGKTAGVPSTASVTIINGPPLVTNLAITPANPTSDDDLRVTFQVQDDPPDVITTNILWYQNEVPTGYTTDTVPGSATQAGDVWRVAVSTQDNEGAYGETTLSVGIPNQPPVIQSVQILPAAPHRASVLSIDVTADDPDGTELTHTWQWMIDGSYHSSDTATLDLSSSWAQVGSNVTLTYNVTDGVLVDSETVTTFVVAAEPSWTGLAISPAQPTVQSSVDCGVTGLIDPDGVVYIGDAKWYRGETFLGSGSPLSLLGGLAVRGDQIRCEREIWDGEAPTDVVSPNVTVVNALPHVTAAYVPVTAGVLDTVSITGLTSVDPDGDEVSYDYVWYVNDFEVLGQTSSSLVLSGVAEKSDNVFAKVTPSDSFGGVGELYWTNTTVIADTPATASVVFNPDPPRGGSGNFAVATVNDVDGDGVSSIQYSFVVNNGVPVVDPDGDMPPVVRGDIVEVTVTGMTAVSAFGPAIATATVVNGAPGYPVITVTDVEGDLVCSVFTDAVDPDGDTLTYSFRWTQNDIKVPAGDLDETTVPGDTVPSGLLVSGDSWTCYGQASDGVATSQESESGLIVP